MKRNRLIRNGKAKRPGASQVSRRQFLKGVGATLGGTAIAGMGLAAGCKPPSTKTADPSESTAGITTLPLTSGMAPTGASPTSAKPTAVTSTTPISTPASTAGAGYIYTPPTARPASMQVPGTSCTVATDRVYNENHIWVKSIDADMSVIGITPTMVELSYEPYQLMLAEVGTKVARGDALGSIEGYKMSSDLMSPVSGKIVQVNDYLTNQGKGGWGGSIPMLMTDPYNVGWMLVLQLSRTDELKSLLTPQQYFALISNMKKS